MRIHPVVQGPVRTGRGLRRAALGSVVAALLAGVVVSTPSLASAAEDEVTIGMARERFKEGVQYFDQKQYDKARAAFLQAYALKRHPAVLLNLAQSELRSGHEADAAKHFAQYLREHKEATESERQGAEAGLAAAKAQVGELSVSADEEGASVLVDGTTEGTTPLPGPLYLTPGTHTITVRKDGRETTTQVLAAAGQSNSASLRLKRSPPTSAPPGQSQRRSDDRADGAREDPPPPAGSRDAEDDASSGDRMPFGRWVASSPIAWVGGGLFVAGVAGSVVFGLGAKSRYDNANSISAEIRREAAEDGITDTTGICTEMRLVTLPRQLEFREACSAYEDRAAAGDQQKTLAIVSAAVAGVAVVGTAVAYLVTGYEDDASATVRRSRATARLVPWASPEARGVVLVGEF